MSAATPELSVRPAEPEDEEAIIDLAARALGWDDEGPHDRLFRWKHRDNPFGTSPMWLAEDDGQLVGFRTFLRWRFRRPGRAPTEAVRAVDTATAPEAQGRGVFTRLTTTAVAQLTDEGVSFVFNTPNDRSRPGYLKMGWQVLGRIPIGVRPAGLRALARMLSARQPARKWSHPTDAGTDARELFADAAATARLLATCPDPPGWSTDRSPAFLAWRYGLPALHYRGVPAGDRLEDGVVVFRLRSRGDALEATVCDVLLPPGRRLGPLLGHLLRSTGADYLVMAGDATRGRALPLPRQGPVLTWRALAPQDTPNRRDLHLTLGDVELF